MVSSGCVGRGRGRARRSTRGGRVRSAESGVPGPARRGPTPALSDAQLLAAIRSDLARSPFQGEGHRQVHARLRILDGIRVSRTRVLRVMRAQGLLSPHRGRQGDPKAHDGTIVTSAPQVMWGTDGVRVFTVEDGWVWTFAAVDHWNAECVGWHVYKVGSRFAALEPIAQGLGRRYGSVEADVARGLALRMDHGSQYLSDHFLNQVRYWGIHPSFGFLEEPETNGVVERWNRTLKEQAIYGRVFHNLADVRAAVAAFVERYNQCWRLEKLAYRTPLEAREQYELRHARSVNVCPRNRVRYMYRPRVLGQWFDGIRIYAAASSPTRSRRTCAGLRYAYFSSIHCSLYVRLNASTARRRSSRVSKRRTHKRFSFSVRMKRSATPLPSGARTKLGELSIPKNAVSCWKSAAREFDPWS